VVSSASRSLFAGLAPSAPRDKERTKNSQPTARRRDREDSRDVTVRRPDPGGGSHHERGSCCNSYPARIPSLDFKGRWRVCRQEASARLCSATISAPGTPTPLGAGWGWKGAVETVPVASHRDRGFQSLANTRPFAHGRDPIARNQWSCCCPVALQAGLQSYCRPEEARQELTTLQLSG